MTYKQFLIPFSILLIILAACKDQGRERDNIFDPKNSTKKIDLGFRLSSQDSSIRLSWNPPTKTNYKSTNIFRIAPGETEATIYAVVEKNTTHFTDTNIIFDAPYSYYLSLNGETEESYPTKKLSITPGPGSIWILDTYLWEINKLNYDLSSTALRKLSAWRPENLSFTKGFKLGLVTYPAFRDLEIFNTKTGEFIAGNSHLERPFDAVYDDALGKFWLVDSTGSLFTIDTSTANAQLFLQDLSKPVQIDLFNQNLFILDQGVNKIYIYDTTPQKADSIYQNTDSLEFAALKQFRLDGLNNNLYFFDGDSGRNILYKYDLLNKSLISIFKANTIYAFDINPIDETIWIIMAKHLNSNLVQLSGNEISKFDISELEKPVDIKILPVNGNLIITDFKSTANINVPKVFHFRTDLSLIGTYTTYGDPYRVYIE
jgi:hypothetical protein